MSPRNAANWLTTPLDTALWWQGAMKSYVSTSLVMMRNLNTLMSASLPLMTQSLKLGEHQVRALAQNAESGAVSMKDAAASLQENTPKPFMDPKPRADPLRDVPVSLAALPHWDEKRADEKPAPLMPAPRGPKLPYPR